MSGCHRVAGSGTQNSTPDRLLAAVTGRAGCHSEGDPKCDRGKLPEGAAEGLECRRAGLLALLSHFQTEQGEHPGRFSGQEIWRRVGAEVAASERPEDHRA